jgi:LPS export ABC transporter protein LptC
MKNEHFFPIFALLSCLLPLAACSFDYGTQGSDKSQPDIVMENVEYVRVRSADPQARFQAERLERYEERRIIELRNFSFEQFGNRGEDINAYGRAGSASIELDSLDMRLDNGVRIDVDSEDLAIETKWLEWKDEARTLTGGPENEVNIFQEKGTAFTGTGFHADARRRTWEFSGSVSGTYVQDDDDDDVVNEEEAGVDSADDATSADDVSSTDDAPHAEGVIGV